MGDIQNVIDALQDAKANEMGIIQITDAARCAMVRILMKTAEQMKEQQHKKTELLHLFDEEIKRASEAKEDCGFDGDIFGVASYAHEMAIYENAKAIAENGMR